MEMTIEESTTFFPDGSITKIVFHNFLTFDDIVFLPGPNLNVIIGPNGNGKSSVICGICLAVGGDPKVLGRSTRIGDYVKHGCEKGFVELHIRDSQKSSDQNVKVVINKSKNSSEYFVKDLHVTRTELRNLIASYNIQIENPCTFLAQDKVRSFAEQNPNLLLKNTEKANSMQLCKMHERLEELENNGTKFLEIRESLKRKIAAVTNELISLEPIVKSYEERKKTLEKVGILEKKNVLLNYQDAVTLYDKNKKQLKKIQLEKNNILKIISSGERDFEEKKNCSELIKKELEVLNTKKQVLDEKLDHLLNSEPVGFKIKRANDNFEQAKKSFDSWTKDVEIIQKEIASLTEALKTAENDSDQAAKKLTDIRKEYQNWRERAEEVENQNIIINKLQCEIRLVKDELDSQALKAQQFEAYKISVLSNNGMSKRLGCLDAWKWYQQHRSQFQFPVYIPLLAINLKNGEYAKYLENVIAARDFLIFIFGCKEDEARLTSSSFSWKVASTIMTTDVVAKSSVEKGLPEHLRQYGFHHMVSELYDAPASVKAYLNRLFHANSNEADFQLDKIPIGNDSTDQRLDEICSALKAQYRLFLTGTSRVRISVSRYTGETSIRTDNLRTNLIWLVAHHPPKELLTDDEKSKRLDSLAKMNAKLRQLQNEYSKSRDDVNINIEKLRREMTTLRKQIDAVTLIRQQLKSKEIRFSVMEENKPDLKEAEQKMEECKKSALAEGFNIVREIHKLLKQSSKVVRDLVIKKLHLTMSKKEVDEIREKLFSCRTELTKKQIEVDEHEEEVRASEEALADHTKKLKEKTGISNVVESEMNADEKRIWQKLQAEFEAAAAPNDLKELRNLLNTEKARLIALHEEGDRKAIDRYQKLSDDILNLRRQLESSSEQVTTWENEIDALLEKWITSLETLIKNINENFATFFQKLGCVGEVCLDKPSNQHDISNYGIDIMVKFRNSAHLRRLTHKTQSGGERSVSTMLYLLAMQELCPVPFRCVDEINQGMDPNNEKMVFEMMVDLLSGVGNLSKTQYFLLTPKLLPGLRYGEKSVIHCIYNGITFPKKGINLNDHLEKARVLQQEQLT